jgi:hypothetical protein
MEQEPQSFKEESKMGLAPEPKSLGKKGGKSWEPESEKSSIEKINDENDTEQGEVNTVQT